MTWVRYDDNVANHPKVAPLDDATYRLWREAIEWCAHNLTDGGIRTHQLAVTSVRASKPRAAKLVTCGLWHPAGTKCSSAKCPPSAVDGWVIHDYWDYQPTRERVREEQAKKAERQRKWLENRRNGGAPKDESADTPEDASQDDAIDASRDGAPAPPRPAPEGRAGTTSPLAPTAAVGDGDAATGEARKTTKPCRTCGNALDSAYHLGACLRTAGAA